MLELMKKHLAAYSAGNWDDYRADLSDDVTYEEIPTQQHVTGPDNYINAVQRWKRGFPDLKADVIGGFAAGDSVVAEIEWEGTQSAALEGPFGTIQPTNKRGRVRTVIVAKTKDGKISEVHHYFDVLTILRQLGVGPMAGAGAQAPTKPAEAPPTRH